jgi:enoyl-CoA hydratase
LGESGSEFVGYEVRDRVAHITIDHGKANALSPEVVGALDRCVSLAESAGAEVGAICIAGKPGFLSGGFDLKVMRADPAAAGVLVTDGGALFARLFASRLPVVVACTGHAVAAGALMLLGADERIGADGDFQIGLIETQIGMVLPRWAVEFSMERLSRRHFQLATLGARMYPPNGARDAGFLDEVVPAGEVLAVAESAAQRWAALPAAAYAGQVHANRSERIRRLEEAIAADRGHTFDIST